MSNYFIGIDLGGTYIKGAIVSEDRKVVARAKHPTEESRGPEHVMDRVREVADEMITPSGLSFDQIAAMGIGVPGLVNWQDGFVYSLTNMTGWKDIDLGPMLQERFDGLPCFVENDATAACYGEYCFGAGRGTQTMALLTLGTGVGGGIVVDGRLVRGIDGTAAEIGHMIVCRDGRQCGCGAHGCLEAYASVTGMVATARERIAENPDCALAEHADALDGAIISRCAEAGDTVSQGILEETGGWLGVGISSLIALLNPECVALSGGMIAAGDRLMKPIQETVDREALTVPAKRAKIVFSELDTDAGVLGAAASAQSRL